CSPYGGNGVGCFAIPPNGTNVWGEFEAGDPDYPIRRGCFWGTGGVPAQPPLPFVDVLEGAAMSLKPGDTPGAGGLSPACSPPGPPGHIKLVCNVSGVEISVGAAKITMTPASVSINNGALEVI